ncbi:Phage-related replication protein [Streptomyces venezuelae]|uniref:poly-gamma-glutamate hydrolase family protein n=1 Tax=Streptomyces gardneri TaxID=66892 RepID=UPI0006BCB22E|nr:poly-gamma-glutamate hydrolase family protein [Streptomyces gardneri]ALO10740.1 Phage-related replication protein [Streptomyces venezuelae]QPK47710.1 poly-gamma-glutamate hydrolase family protein [Streptomyces gardneri]WRK39156.1 poly-gamma-glutamate hydrolase family protein [Streptomyces venezuelae]CUM38775.1 phage-related protein [Streptomyces venezuelae]
MTPFERSASRRTILTALAAAATTGAPVLGQLAAASPASAALPSDVTLPDPVEYKSNTLLYQDTNLVEGTSYSRRYRRHQQFDLKMSQKYGFQRTAILALHGGGIEIGTSELCLGIAGYSPGSAKDEGMGDPAGDPILPTVHDYFMFEGLLSDGNSALHVTSKNCDDHVALATAASHLNVLSLHGCKFEQLNLPTATYPPTGDLGVAVVGGLNAAFRAALVTEINNAGFQAVDAYDPRYSATLGEFNGSHDKNPCNRTMLAMGAQLELTTDLRKSLFGDPSSRGRRAETWYRSGGRFEAFRDACRRAIATVEAGQPIL